MSALTAPTPDSVQIMVIDDTPDNLSLLNEILTTAGYRVRPASSARFAMKAIASELPDLILLDVNMPVMDGYQVCTELKAHERTRAIPVIFISALNDIDDKVRGLSVGGVDYITKPFQTAEVLARIETHLTARSMQKIIETQNVQLQQEVVERTRAEEELTRHKERLEELVAERTEELNKALDMMTEMSTEIIERLTAAAEFKDEDTGQHIVRIGLYAYSLSLQMGLPEVFAKQIFVAASMHDIGKIGIPDSILLKPDRLTKEEFETIKKHTLIGEKILRGSPHSLLQMAADIALTHHERWDGNGYPHGIAGNDIPVAGRIVMLADQYDALRNSRVYKPAFSHEKTCDIIINGDGYTTPAHFDPSVLSAFKEIMDDFNHIFESCSLAQKPSSSDNDIEAECIKKGTPSGLTGFFAFN